MLNLILSQPSSDLPTKIVQHRSYIYNAQQIYASTTHKHTHAHFLCAVLLFKVQQTPSSCKQRCVRVSKLSESPVAGQRSHKWKAVLSNRWSLVSELNRALLSKQTAWLQLKERLFSSVCMNPNYRKAPFVFVQSEKGWFSTT